MYRLAPNLIQQMLGEPESGMGYQVVRVELRDDSTEFGVVYNAQLLLFADESTDILTKVPYDRLIERAKESVGEIRALKVISRLFSDSFVREAGLSESGSEGPAVAAPTTRTEADEVFKRFSAYANDNRLTADFRWLPGTYATTEADAIRVRSGREAVSRYALPNPAPASNVFTGKPWRDTDIQRGTVMPAFSQPGGGAEVIFPAGTQPRTVSGPARIPDA
ncbi:MAG: hypothetical protein WC815_01190 [Vicinamibacterales bacterium]|jgi:hypothetical protein